jgi:hypothetical protein
MKNHLIIVFICLAFCKTTFSQPGYSLSPLQFKVFYQGEDFINRTERDIVLEWRSDNLSVWQRAKVQNGMFITGNTAAERNLVEIKIYRTGMWDTMFISTNKSLTYIPFQPGRFVFDNNTAPLANMKTFAGVRIVNQSWKYFSETKKEKLPLLIKQRYAYISKELYPYETEREDEPEVQYKAFNKSSHIKEVSNDSYEVYMEPGQLYYAPALSSAVYSVGYLNDLDKKEPDYRPYLLESKDACHTWKILFAMQETDAQLANITERGFVFLREGASQSFITYNTAGNIVDSVFTNDACADIQNIFSPCDNDIKFSGMQLVETSSPYMAANSNPHIFNRRFTNDGVHFLSIDVLPFYPNQINRSVANGNEEKILELNAGDTYAYLTIRKNKVVLLSYDYTLVSKDFGNTWMYFRNGLLNGGNWNFIWLDDNTLVNVLSEYADIIKVE